MTVQDSPPAPGPVLQAIDIEKRFGPVHALRNASLEVHPGEVVALIGDNGAGKSTLINVLTGVLTPDGGEIRFGGEPVHFTSPHEARAAGIETVLVNGSCVWRGGAPTGARPGRALRRADLDPPMKDWRAAG